MQSYRRPRGRIFFEAVCALTAGVSFVGAWIQTGAWAFIGPAFVFTLFGLYWAMDMFAQQGPSVAAPQPGLAPAGASAPVEDRQPAPAATPEIRFERFEPPVDAAPERVPVAIDDVEVHTDVVPFASAPEPLLTADPAPLAVDTPKKARKSRARKIAEPAVEQAPVAAADEEPGFDHHIEQLFDPQPFARQARPAFGKRSRGPGPRPLPA